MLLENASHYYEHILLQIAVDIAVAAVAWTYVVAAVATKTIVGKAAAGTADTGGTDTAEVRRLLLLLLFKAVRTVDVSSSAASIAIYVSFLAITTRLFNSCC